MCLCKIIRNVITTEDHLFFFQKKEKKITTELIIYNAFPHCRVQQSSDLLQKLFYRYIDSIIINFVQNKLNKINN